MQPASRFSIRAPDFIVPTFTQNVKVVSAVGIEPTTY